MEWRRPSIDEINGIIKAMPEYERIKSDDVLFECEEFSDQLCSVLHGHGIEALHVSNYEHNHVLCMADKGPIVIDLTIRQFFRDFPDDFFIGSRMELDKYVAKNDYLLGPENDYDLEQRFYVSDMWRNPLLNHHLTDEIHEDDKCTFQEKWGPAGLCQFPEYMPANQVDRVEVKGRTKSLDSTVSKSH